MKMKSILLSCLLAGVPALLSAQKILPFGIDLGVKAGANFNQINGNGWESGYNTNLLAGIFGGVNFKRVGVGAEVFFSQSKHTVTGPSFYAHYHEYYSRPDVLASPVVRLSHINVPLLLHVKALPMIWVHLGPQYSAVISAKEKGGDLLKDAADIFKNGAVSGVAGLELRLPLGFRVNGRYVFGFSDVNNTVVADTWKQRSIQLGVAKTFL